MVFSVFQKLGQAIERWQRKAADYLNRKGAGLKPQQQAVGLIIFCLLFGGSSAFTIWHSLRSSGGVIKIQPMSGPSSVLVTDSSDWARGRLSKYELEGIRMARRYLDSLQLTTTGQVIYESIARTRPGLLDSLTFIESRYYKQLNIDKNEK